MLLVWVPQRTSTQSIYFSQSARTMRVFVFFLITATSLPNTFLSPGSTSKWAKRYRTSAAEIRCRALPAAKKRKSIDLVLFTDKKPNGEISWKIILEESCPMDERIENWMDQSTHQRYNIFVNWSNTNVANGGTH